MTKTSSTLTREEIWELVRQRALVASSEQTPIFTLQKRVRNFITDVAEGSIGRVSDEGKTNSSRIQRSMVFKVWDALVENGTTKAPDGILYFTMGLMQKLLPEYIEHIDAGELALMNSERAATRKEKIRDETGSGTGKWGKGGEGPIHKAIKEFVYSNPDEALSKLGPAPFTSIGMEFPLGNDLVDVVLMDADGCILLVEVKPHIEPGDKWPFAQAAKYRTLWHILKDTPLDGIRAVVVAPEIPASTADSMKKKHEIESAKVAAP